MIEAIRSQQIDRIPNQLSTRVPKQQTNAISRGMACDRLELSSQAQERLPEHVPGELIVRFKPGAEMAMLNQRLGLEVIRKFPTPRNGVMAENLDNIYQMRFSQDIPIQTVLVELNHDPSVAYAEPNFIVRIVGNPQQKPNDLDAQLWGLHNTGQNGGTADADIDAPEAWALTTGSKTGPVIGVIDTGVDYTHPDLKDNMWTNPGEIPGDGKDNDNNGYIDDIHGWDFANNDNDPLDDHNHGTHVSGTIAAKGNDGKGIVGVNWNAQIMALKFLSGGGSGTTADAIRAVLYATDNGANLTSNSWGGGGYSQALSDAIANSSLFIAAAGNDGTDNDSRPHYPSNYDLPNVVSVAASDRNDQKASFSNYGKTTVDLAAPGKDIYSTVAGGGYASYSGTSMATPHVSGVAGLILSKYPNATGAQVKSRLLNGVDPVSAFAENTVSGGRLNAYNSLDDDSTPPGTVQNLGVTSNSYQSLTLAWQASGDDGQSGTASRYDIRYSESPITESNWAQAQPVAQALKPLPSGSTQSFTLSGLQPALEGKTYYVGLKVLDNVGNTSSLASVQAQTAPARIVFSDDAESERNLWKVEQPWSRSHTNTVQGMAWTDSPGGEYGNNLNVSLTSKKIDLNGATQATLMFTHKFELETGYDFGYLEVSKDGQNWNLLKKYNGQAGWQRESVNLSNYAGQEVQIRFRTKTDASVSQDGWSVDNVTVATDRK